MLQYDFFFLHNVILNIKRDFTHKRNLYLLIVVLSYTVTLNFAVAMSILIIVIL